MQEYTHNCIKCSAQYKSSDIDPYYCEACDEQRKAIAKEIDKKMKGRSTIRPKSELQIFDEIAQSRGGKRNTFVRIDDLGIKL